MAPAATATALAFAPPLSPSKPRSPSPEPDAEPYLSTTAGELAFFRALIQHRPVGLDKHWEMMGVALHLRDHIGDDKEVKIGQGELWAKYQELYDEETLQATWEGEQLDALDDEEGEGAESKELADTESESAWIDVRFPRKDFTLLMPPSKLTPSLDESLFASLASRIADRAAREEGAPASPPSGPVREFSLELPDVEVEEENGKEDDKPKGRGARGQGRAANRRVESDSPKKKRAKVAAREEAGDEVSGSDLSELEDDDEEGSGADDDEGEEGSSGGSEGEGEGEDYQEDGKKDTASAIRGLPSSKRKRTTRSASAPTSDAASTKQLSAADAKKEKAKLAMRARRAKIKADKEAAEAKADSSNDKTRRKKR